MQGSNLNDMDDPNGLKYGRNTAQVLIRGGTLRQLLQKTPFNNVEIQKLCLHYKKSCGSDEMRGMNKAAFRMTFGMSKFFSNALFEWVLKTPDLINISGTSNVTNTENDVDNYLSFEEFLVAVIYICPRASDEEKIRLAFSMFDKDGDGWVTQEEFEIIMNECSIQNNEELGNSYERHMRTSWTIASNQVLDYPLFKKIVTGSDYYGSFLQAMTVRKHWLLKIIGNDMSIVDRTVEDPLHDFLSCIFPERVDGIRELLQDNLINKVQELRTLSKLDYLEMGLKEEGELIKQKLTNEYVWEDSGKPGHTLFWTLSGIYVFLAFAVVVLSMTTKNDPTESLVASGSAAIVLLNAAILVLVRSQRLFLDRIRRISRVAVFPVAHIKILTKYTTNIMIVFALLHAMLQLTAITAFSYNTIIGLALVVLLGVVGFPYAKANWGVVSLVLHYLFYVALLVHCVLPTDSVPTKRYAFLGLAPFFLMYSLEAVMTLIQACRSARVQASAKCLGRVVCLDVSRPPNFVFRPGQYVMYNCPGVSWADWRPLYITSLPSRDNLSFHVEVTDWWSNEVFMHYEGTEKLKPCRITGPYGPGLQCSEQTVMLIVSDDMVSAAVGLVKKIVQEVEDPQSPIEKCFLFWILKQRSNYQWFLELVNKTQRDMDRSSFEAKIFLQSGSSDLNFGMNLIMSMNAVHAVEVADDTNPQAGTANILRKNTLTGLTGLDRKAEDEDDTRQSNLVMCRPDFHREFQKVRNYVICKRRMGVSDLPPLASKPTKGKVGVYYFGSQRTGRRMRYFCNEYTDFNCDFVLHSTI